MTIRVHGGNALVARLRAVAPTTALMRDLGLDVVAAQKREAPVKTGNLRRAIRLGRVTKTGLATHATAEYAAFVEFGTRPHEIVPRNARALRFARSGVATTLSGRPTAAARRAGGAYTFARRVQHPGTRSNPFMQRGIESVAVARQIKDYIITRWNRAA